MEAKRHGVETDTDKLGEVAIAQKSISRINACSRMQLSNAFSVIFLKSEGAVPP